ncbi:hypothetical protein EXS57_02745 [Candidatus Kaiserbacteria bacterium]|nr:hypothetical protein [Candidatus Kaiserbacteria bacterium]
MKRFNFISNANKALSLFWLVAISLSIIGIAFAAAPNPGHDITAVSGGAVQGDLFYGSDVDTFLALPKNVTATRYLSNTGASNNPAWAQVNLTNGVTGILPTANGGTGIAFFTAAGPTVARIYTFPDAAITVNAAANISGATLASNVLSSSLTTVGALAAGSIASGFGTITTGNTISAPTYTGAGAVTLQSGSAANLSLLGGTSGQTQNVQIGAGGAGNTTPDLFVLDAKSTAGDPTGVAGGAYFNVSANKSKCFENSAWTSCSGWVFLGKATGSGVVTIGPVIWTGTFKNFYFEYVITGYSNTTVGRILVGAASISTAAATNGNNLMSGVTLNATSVGVPGVPLAVTLSNIARSGYGFILGDSGSFKQITISGQNGNPAVATSPTQFHASSFFSDLGTNLPLQRIQMTTYDAINNAIVSSRTFTAGSYIAIWGRNDD